MMVDCRIRINPDSFIRRKNKKKEKYEKKLMEKRNEKRI